MPSTSKRLHVKLGIFGAVPILMLQDKRVTPNALKVYIALRSFEGVNDYCDVGQDKLSERSGVPTDSLTVAVKVLVETRWVTVERRMNKPNRYQTCAYLEAAPEFEKPDGRVTNRFDDSETPCPENFQAPVPGKLPDTVSGKLPGALKDLGKDLEEKSDARAFPVAAAPGSNGKHRNGNGKHSPEEVALFREVADAMVARGDHWTKGAAESAQLYSLITWSKLQDPEHWRDFLKNIVAMFWQLKQGTAPGQTYKERPFWSKQPFTPCGLSPHATRVAQYMRADTEDVMEGLTR